MKNKKPKILLLDFETSPALGYFWGSVWETNIIEVVKYEHILCVGWKWYGESSVHVKGLHDFTLYKKDKNNDKELVTFFSNIMKKADVVIGHNSDQFDLTVFNTRLLANNLPPVPQSKSIDTKKISKSRFHLPSNKLDDISSFLGVGNKLPHTGKKLWFDYMKGDKKAINLMEKYCKQDIALLDRVLRKIIPFMKPINEFSRLDGERPNCPNPTCGSSDMIKSKLKITIKGLKQQYQCKECGTYYTDPRVIK